MQKFDWRDIIKFIRKFSATILRVHTEILIRDFPNAAQCYHLTRDARFQTFQLLDRKDFQKKYATKNVENFVPNSCTHGTWVADGTHQTST